MLEDSVNGARRLQPTEQLSDLERLKLWEAVDAVVDETSDQEFLGPVARLCAEVTHSPHGVAGRLENSLLIASEVGERAPKSFVGDQWRPHWRTALESGALLRYETTTGGPESTGIVVPICRRGSTLGLLDVSGKASAYGSQDVERLTAIARHVSASVAERYSRGLMEARRQELARGLALQAEDHKLARDLMGRMLRENAGGVSGIRHALHAQDGLFNGDLFLVARTPGGGTRWLLGDAVGHGLSAAIIGLPVASIFHATAKKGVPLIEVVKTINDALVADLPPGLFCAAQLLELDAEGHTLTAWNGGMPPVVVRRSRRQDTLLVHSSDPALGILPSAHLSLVLERIDVSPGERIYCFSDGVIETCDPSGEQFGVERVVAKVSNGIEADAFSALCDGLQQFRGYGAHADDLSLIEVTVERKLMGSGSGEIRLQGDPSPD